MQRTCANHWCQSYFDVTPDDLALLKTLSPTIAGKTYPLPPPTLCPDCRLQRRMAWRNERNLYHRTCGLSGRDIISIYSSDKKFQVFGTQEWWSDGWDPFATGREYDLKRPFLEQWAEIQDSAPRITLLSKNSENSDYTNHAAGNRNCYLSTIVFNSEDVHYSRKAFTSKNVVDCGYIMMSGELLYECFFGEQLYNCTFCNYCFSSSDCHFCEDCKGCNNCFMCINLRNRSHVFQGKQLTPAEYAERMKELQFGSYDMQQILLRQFEKLRRLAIHPALFYDNCEDSSGDYLIQCKDAKHCFYSAAIEHCRYICECDRSAADRTSSNCMDVFGFGASDLLYEVQAQANGYQNITNNFSYDAKQCFYVDNCQNVQDCIGCVGLKNAQYCIFNRQYTQEEYETLAGKVIEKLMEEKLWGEFFPASLSPFGYNETVAQEHFPLTDKEARKRGFSWSTVAATPPQADRTISAAQLPDSIDAIPDDILNWAITCEASRKPFKIIKQELDFYRKMRLPVPHLHPDERHKRRMALRNPMKLWERTCGNCGKGIETTYAPERPEMVYCEECYLKEVY